MKLRDLVDSPLVEIGYYLFLVAAFMAGVLYGLPYDLVAYVLR